MSNEKFLVPTWEEEYKLIEYRVKQLNESLVGLKDEGLESFMTSAVLMDILNEPKKGFTTLMEAAVKFEQDKVLRPTEKKEVADKWNRLFSRLSQPINRKIDELRMTPFYKDIQPYIHVRNTGYLIKIEAKAAFKELRTVESQPYHEEFAAVLNEYLQAEQRLKTFWEDHTSDYQTSRSSLSVTTNKGVYNLSRIKHYIAEDGTPDFEKIVLSPSLHDKREQANNSTKPDINAPII